MNVESAKLARKAAQEVSAELGKTRLLNTCTFCIFVIKSNKYMFHILVCWWYFTSGYLMVTVFLSFSCNFSPIQYKKPFTLSGNIYELKWRLTLSTVEHVDHLKVTASHFLSFNMLNATTHYRCEEVCSRSDGPYEPHSVNLTVRHPSRLQKYQ